MLFGFAAISSIWLTASVVLASAAPSAASTSAASIGPRVRGVTPEALDLLSAGARRSPTFARLIRELQASDLVVYVEVRSDLPAGLDGRLMFIASAGGVRYLLAQVQSTGGLDASIAIAGHELQHALEIAAHADVHDSAALAQLYGRIGIQVSGKNRYDTVAARLIGRRVRAELW